MANAAEEIRSHFRTMATNPVKLGDAVESISNLRMFEHPFNTDQIELEALKVRVKNLEREVARLQKPDSSLIYIPNDYEVKFYTEAK